MSSREVDRNLLFGFLALQNDFVSREDLIAAVSVWLANKSQPLSDIMRQRKLLADDERQLLESLAAKHLQRHSGDLEASLSTVACVPAVRSSLEQLRDPDVNATLAVAVRSTQGSKGPVAEETLPVTTDIEKQRYRVLRPHAKGGVGQVFVAMDTELNREVALKEIQPDYADDSDSRQRFVQEAEVTGGLEHPGIVPVYGFGHYADGRPYYAMRFIRGTSLKESIEQYYRQRRGDGDCYSSLEFRKLLSQFISICQAVDYAHSRGVLHRDLKPGNVMLGKFGETLVVDWGLARVRGKKEHSVATDERTFKLRSGTGTATQLGSTIGTPAYMSPEQAAGHIDLLDRATDIYSLGATLYSLLTSQTPFPKTDLFEILRCVQRGDFEPPRAVRRGVPLGLDAICLKAMALRPVDRYASAAELAADVERWLADEPIIARRENLSERAWRWVRRHRTFMQTAALGLAAIAVISVTAYFFVDQARKKEASAKSASQELYRMAQGYNDRWLPSISEVLRYSPGGLALRERLLVAASEDYEKLIKFQVADSRLELERGRTQVRLGDTQRDLGQADKAQATYQNASQHFQQLQMRFPEIADDARVDWGRVRNREGGIWESQGNPQALTAWKETIKALDFTAGKPPVELDRRLVLASAQVSIADWLAREQQSSAAKELIDAALNVLALPASLALQSQSPAKHDQLERIQLRAIGLSARQLATEGKWLEAKRHLTEAERIAKAAVTANDAEPSRLSAYAEIQLEMANALRGLGLRDEESTAHANALSIYRRLNEILPGVADSEESIVITLLDQSQLFLEMQRMPDAAVALADAEFLLDRLMQNTPSNTHYQQEVAVLRELRGRQAHLAGQGEIATQQFVAAIKLLAELINARPEVPEFRERSAVARIQRARSLASTQETTQAEKDFSEAETALSELRSVAPDDPRFAIDLAWLYFYRGRCRWDRGDTEIAKQDFQVAIQSWKDTLRRWPSVASDRALAELLTHCPVVELRDPDLAVRLARQALETAPHDSQTLTTLGWALFRRGQVSEALQVLEQSRMTGASLAANSFAFAVAYQHNEDLLAAHRCFDQGASLAQSMKGDELTQQLAAEAASMLDLAAPR